MSRNPLKDLLDRESREQAYRDISEIARQTASMWVGRGDSGIDLLLAEAGSTRTEIAAGFGELRAVAADIEAAVADGFMSTLASLDQIDGTVADGLSRVSAGLAGATVAVNTGFARNARILARIDTRQRGLFAVTAAQLPAITARLGVIEQTLDDIAGMISRPVETRAAEAYRQGSYALMQARLARDYPDTNRWHKEAVGQLTVSTQHNKFQPATWYNLGLANLGLHRTQKAGRAFASCLFYGQNIRRAFRAYVLLLAVSSWLAAPNSGEASKLLDRYANEFDDCPEVHVALSGLGNIESVNTVLRRWPQYAAQTRHNNTQTESIAQKICLEPNSLVRRAWRVELVLNQAQSVLKRRKLIGEPIAPAPITFPGNWTEMLMLAHAALPILLDTAEQLEASLTRQLATADNFPPSTATIEAARETIASLQAMIDTSLLSRRPDVVAALSEMEPISDADRLSVQNKLNTLYDERTFTEIVIGDAPADATRLAELTTKLVGLQTQRESTLAAVMGLDASIARSPMGHLPVEEIWKLRDMTLGGADISIDAGYADQDGVPARVFTNTEEIVREIALRNRLEMLQSKLGKIAADIQDTERKIAQFPPDALFNGLARKAIIDAQIEALERRLVVMVRQNELLAALDLLKQSTQQLDQARRQLAAAELAHAEEVRKAQQQCAALRRIIDPLLDLLRDVISQTPRHPHHSRLVPSDQPGRNTQQ